MQIQTNSRNRSRPFWLRLGLPSTLIVLFSCQSENLMAPSPTPSPRPVPSAVATRLEHMAWSLRITSISGPSQVRAREKFRLTVCYLGQECAPLSPKAGAFIQTRYPGADTFLVSVEMPEAYELWKRDFTANECAEEGTDRLSHELYYPGRYVYVAAEPYGLPQATPVASHTVEVVP